MVFRSTRPKVCKVPSAQWNLVSCGSSGCSIEYRCPKALKDPDSTVKNATFLRGHWAEIWPEHCTDGGSTFLTIEGGWNQSQQTRLGWRLWLSWQSYLAVSSCRLEFQIWIGSVHIFLLLVALPQAPSTKCTAGHKQQHHSYSYN